MGSNAFMRELTAWSGPMPAHDYGVEGVGVDETASLPVKPGSAPISGDMKTIRCLPAASLCRKYMMCQSMTATIFITTTSWPTA